MDFSHYARQIVSLGQRCHGQGWVPATSGNLSARVAADRFAITRSGCHKGELSTDDVLLIDRAAVVRSGEGQPSAETGLHLGIYARNSSANYVLHTHSVLNTVLSMESGDALLLENYELLKLFDSVTTHETQYRIPIFENDQDIERLEARVSASFTSDVEAGAYLIAGHGMYTWGSDPQDAWNKLEALEFLFRCETMRRQIR